MAAPVDEVFTHFFTPPTLFDPLTLQLLDAYLSAPLLSMMEASSARKLLVMNCCGPSITSEGHFRKVQGLVEKCVPFPFISNGQQIEMNK
jgi:hypothetical protein